MITKKNKDTFCLLPFTMLDINPVGEVRTCCMSNQHIGYIYEEKLKDIWNNDKLKQLQLDLANGIRNEWCSKCWSEEDSNIVSMRQFNLNAYLNGGSVAVPTSSLDVYKTQPNNLVLNFGNKCNLACRICYPLYSSLWLDESLHFSNNTELNSQDLYKHQILKITEQSTKSFSENNSIWNTLNEWLPNVEVLSFLGGEPMINKKAWELIEKSVSLGYAKKQMITFNTNCTVYKKEYMELLNEFKNVCIYLSIDDVGDRFEYARYPGKWDKVYKNLQLYLESNFHVMICPTISILNIYYLEEIVNILNNVHWNFLHAPKYLCIRNLPNKVKELITEKFKKINFERFERVLNFMNGEQSDKNEWNKFFKYIEQHDSYRNQNFNKTFSEFAKILKKYNV